jgi:hypothetical protein
MDHFPKIKPEAIVSAIQIHSVADPDGLHVVLEGDDDVTLLKRLFKACGWVRWHDANGRPNVFRVHRLCQSNRMSGVLFVADADWHRRLGALEECENVAYTDRNDMECTVLAVDPVLQRHQGRFVSAARANAFLTKAGHDSLFSAAVERASRLGVYRFINHRDKLSLAFKNRKPCTELPYDTFLSEGEDMAWNDGAFREWLAGRNCDMTSEVARLFKAHEAIGGLEDEPLDWCQGHDLLAIHAVLHSRISGTPCDVEVAGRQLEDLVRRQVSPGLVREADVIRRLEVFVGCELLDDEGAA